MNRITKYNDSLFEDDELGPVVGFINNQDDYTRRDIIMVEHYFEMRETDKRKMRLLNKHLLPYDTPSCGKFQIPQVLPYRGHIPEEFVPYSAKVSPGSENKGIYCHLHDYCFNSTWTHPIQALRKMRRYKVAVAPDYTMWVDGRVCENIEQERRSRVTQRFFQNNGVDMIQTASWADAESIETYAFDGLADDSWTAIGHQRIGNKCERRLFQYGVKRLVELKRPLGLLVFGLPLDFDPGVPVIVKKSFISKLRHL